MTYFSRFALVLIFIGLLINPVNAQYKVISIEKPYSLSIEPNINQSFDDRTGRERFPGINQFFKGELTDGKTTERNVPVVGWMNLNEPARVDITVDLQSVVKNIARLTLWCRETDPVQDVSVLVGNDLLYLMNVGFMEKQKGSTYLSFLITGDFPSARYIRFRINPRDEDFTVLTEVIVETKTPSVINTSNWLQVKRSPDPREKE
jgi:hypothetical protein